MSQSETGSSLFDLLSQPPDERAWNRFVGSYRPRIVDDIGAHCKKNGWHVDREDLAQDVLMQLVVALPKFHYNAKRSFRGFVHVLSRRAIVNAFRRVKTRSITCADNASALEDVAGASADLEDTPNDGTTLALVEKIATLVEGDLWREAERHTRQSVSRHDWKCYVTWKKWKTGKHAAYGEDLAAHLGTSVNNVHKKASRVRQAIRERLEQLLAKK